MNPKTCNTICIILAILIVGLIGYAAMNGGKLWNEEKYYYFGGKPPGCTNEKNCPIGTSCQKNSKGCCCQSCECKCNITSCPTGKTCNKDANGCCKCV